MNAPATAPSPSTSRFYSPFWALGLLFATLIFSQAFYVMGDLKQKSRLQAARAQLRPMLTQAQTISQTTEAVGRELLALSANSAEAAKIIAEFKIKQSAPAEPAPQNRAAP